MNPLWEFAMSYEHVFYLFPLVVGMVLSNTAQATAADEPLVFISAFAPGEEGAILQIWNKSYSI